MVDEILTTLVLTGAETSPGAYMVAASPPSLVAVQAWWMKFGSSRAWLPVQHGGVCTGARVGVSSRSKTGTVCGVCVREVGGAGILTLVQLPPPSYIVAVFLEVDREVLQVGRLVIHVLGVVAVQRPCLKPRGRRMAQMTYQ